MNEATPRTAWRLVAGRPCLDFVNTVGGRLHEQPEKGGTGIRVLRESLGGYDDLLLWADCASLLSGRELGRLRRQAGEEVAYAAAVFARALAFREALYRLGAAVAQGRSPAAGDVSWLEQEWHEARDAQRLAGRSAGIALDFREEPRLERVLWPLALDAVELFTGDRLERLKQCPGDECGWLFLDTSRNGSRQWCEMRDCGNLAKVRRFRERHRG